MDRLSEVEARELDVHCRLPASPASRTAVIRLRALTGASTLFSTCLTSCAARLRRCVLYSPAGFTLTSAALTPATRALCIQGISADTRWGVHDAPVLCTAVQRGSERALKALLDGLANVTLADNMGMTAAHAAAGYGRTACLRLLIDAGAQLEVKTYCGFTLLHCAAQEGHAECCSLLLAMGCNANARHSGSGDTALVRCSAPAGNCARV